MSMSDELRERNILKLILIVRFTCASLDVAHPIKHHIVPEPTSLEDPQLSYRGLPRYGGFHDRTHARTHRNNISVIYLAILEKVTEYCDAHAVSDFVSLFSRKAPLSIADDIGYVERAMVRFPRKAMYMTIR
jgi:hypothetical protein